MFFFISIIIILNIVYMTSLFLKNSGITKEVGQLKESYDIQAQLNRHLLESLEKIWDRMNLIAKESEKVEENIIRIEDLEKK